MNTEAVIQRIYHPWHLWEDYKHNFHGGVLPFDKEKALVHFCDLLRDKDWFESALKVITSEWKYSCEHNLTNEALNRIAWLGQACVALRYNVPGSVSMSGYNLLTLEEQQAADSLAEKYLNLWIEKNVNTQKVS